MPHHAHMMIVSVVLYGLAIGPATAKVTAIWASSPVRAGEMVLVRGDGFEKDCHVELAAVGNDDEGVTRVPVYQVTATSLKFAVPERFGEGMYRYRIVNTDGSSDGGLLNMPEVWWVQGDRTEQASPGGWVRCFGLTLGGMSCKVRLVGGEGNVRAVSVRSGDEYMVEAALPGDIAAGTYVVRVHNGWGGDEGWMDGGSIVISKARVWPVKVFDVTEYGARPDDPMYLQYYTGMHAPGQDDDTSGIQKAIDAAGENGGGVVYFPRGIYVLSKGLTVGKYVTLRGQGRGMVALSWVDDTQERKQTVNDRRMLIYEPTKDVGNKPHPYLIRGVGDFAVEELSMYAVNHHAGIQSMHGYRTDDSGNVRIHRVLMRLDRYVNAYSGRHYTDYKDVLAKRRADTRRVGAIDIGGNNIEITQCDVYSSRQVLTLNRATGRISGNRFTARPRHWIVFARGCSEMIFEDNYCANGGVSLNSTHGIVSNDGKTSYLAAYSRHLYCARNRMHDSYVKDRDGGFNSDFHGPTGFYNGRIVSASGRLVMLPDDLATGGMEDKWLGAAVIVVGGKGAGQYRRIVGGSGRQVESDRPWLVEPDGSSTISCAKSHDHVIAVDNKVWDTGNTVLFWCGGLDMVAARNVSVRGGSIQLTSLASYGGILAGMRAQFFDNVIEEGINWGAAYIFPRGSFIGSITYPPVYVGYEAGDARMCDYRGAFCMDQVFRRNRIENNGRFYVGGNVDNVLLEGCVVRHADVGIEVDKKGGRWTDAMEGGPTNVLVHAADIAEVKRFYGGNRMEDVVHTGARTVESAQE